jgi:methionine-rich copper-binding protein CopC
VELTTPDGRTLVLSPLAQDPKDVRAVIAPLPADLKPGRYRVRWRALSPDAHHTQGDFSFTVAAQPG